MKTWNDYKNHVSSESDEWKREIEECEELSRIISRTIKGLHDFGLPVLTTAARRQPRRGHNAGVKAY